MPSKKILIAIGILVVVGIIYFAGPHLISFIQTIRGKIALSGKPPEPLIATTAAPDTFSRDTDGDGIPDWQENLFGLNPNKADSNGDGTPDTLPTINGVSIGDLVQTDDTGKLTAAVYAQFQNTPTDQITPDKVSAVTQAQILAQAESIEKTFKKYQTIDLDLGDSDSPLIVAYQKSIAKIVDDTIGDPLIFAKNIQETVLKNGDTTSETVILNSFIKKLLALTTPAKIGTMHLALVNASYNLVQLLALSKGTDELATYTRSLIAQKNINAAAQAITDINTLAALAASSQN